MRELGFAVKLDTNGCFPGRLEQLLRDDLLDYVAMDIKNSPEKYPQTVGVPGLDLTPIRESIALLRNAGVDYEFRTTVVRQLHTADDILAIGRWLEGAPGTFYRISWTPALSSPRAFPASPPKSSTASRPWPALFRTGAAAGRRVSPRLCTGKTLKKRTIYSVLI